MGQHSSSHIRLQFLLYKAYSLMEDNTSNNSSSTDTTIVNNDIFLKYMKPLADVKRPKKLSLDEVIFNSNKFPAPFPVANAKLATLLEAGYSFSTLEEYINSAYPVIHEQLLPLLVAFLHTKARHGRRKEKDLYKEAGILDLVDRLLKKRPITFHGRPDFYMLRDGTEGCGGFENIGHTCESSNICLNDYMSYDEIKLAALVGVSSKSHFINKGDRHNDGNHGVPGEFQPSGVIIGLVGARFQKPGYMDWQDCIVTQQQNKADCGYGTVTPEKYLMVKKWGQLWGQTHLPTWEEIKDMPSNRYTEVYSQVFLNNNVYKARIKMSAEILLAEACTRAKEASLKAYIHVVGLGLGVWRAHVIQDELFVEAFGDAIAAQTNISNISHIDFSYFHVKTCNGLSSGDVFPGTDVRIQFSKRGLHDPVPKDTLLIVCYAWDGNSMPGNEFWRGGLHTSGDAAAACSSGVAELHNVYINTFVTPANLHIATTSGVLHISEYAKQFIEEHSD